MRMKINIKKYWGLLLFLFCICFSIILGGVSEESGIKAGSIITIIGISLLIFISILLFILKKLKKDYLKYFVFLLLFIVYIGYILNTNCGTRQHDTRSLNWQNGGHFGYIQYILENNELPDFNPTEKWCFTNPPLFYIISVLFIKFQNLLGRYNYQALENLQFLTVFFIMIFNIYLYKILKILNIKKIKEWLVLFVGLSPGIVYLSGSLNNDALSIMLCTMAIFYSISWYKKSKFKDLVKLSLFMGLAIMTKINSVIIAVPIIILLFIKLIKEKENIKKYLLYYMVLALVVLPLGLWFPIKNLIVYNIPITYVQEVPEREENPGYIGERTLLDRFFKIENEYIKDINLKFEAGKADYNIFLTTIKSFIVDEKIDYSDSIILKILVFLLFLINILMIIIFLFSIFKNKINIENIFLYLILLLEIVFYIKFCLDYPYNFTMNFRYIIPTIIVFSVQIGLLCEKQIKLNVFIKNLIIIYSIISILLFLNIK